MRQATALLALVALVACGADGAPERQRGATGLSASASIGVGGAF
ncbi:MAG: hypothetical protein AAGA06_14000 [Pseudomonadota bacterium]